jgi:hypothetical protein
MSHYVIPATIYLRVFLSFVMVVGVVSASAHDESERECMDRYNYAAIMDAAPKPIDCSVDGESFG